MLLLLFISLLNFSTAAKILAIIPTPCLNEEIVHRELWKRLSLNHSVTLATSHPSKELKNLKNISVISLEEETYDFMKGGRDWSDLILDNDPFNEVRVLSLARELTSIHMKNPKFRELFGKRFDVVFVEEAYPEYLGYGDLHRVPTILISSSEPYFWTHYYMGNPSHPLIYPKKQLHFNTDLGFEERIVSSLFRTYVYFYYRFHILPWMQQNVDEFFGTHLASLETIFEKVDLLFINANPYILNFRPLGPTSINIWDGRSLTANEQFQELPLITKQMLDENDENDENIVYINLGSVSNILHRLSRHNSDAFEEIIRKLPQKVIWACNTHNGTILLDKKYHCVDQIYQLQILRHHHVNLFITNAEILSLEHGIDSETTMVSLPFFYEQRSNAKILEEKGILRLVRPKSINFENELEYAILDVLNNPKYKENAKKIKSFLLEEPISGLEKAAWWTEFAIKHNGTKHLRVRSLPIYQYFFIDVGAFACIGIIWIIVGIIVLHRFLKIALWILRKAIDMLYPYSKDSTIKIE